MRSVLRPKFIIAAFGLGIIHATLVHHLTRIVPDPYMDEIFHVNQTREICQGNIGYHNPLITTPPLIYYAAAFGGFCNHERFFNSAIIPFLFIALCRLRMQFNGHSGWEAIGISTSAILLPVLFETSLLFYTDLLSLTLVTFALSFSSTPSFAALLFTLSVFSRQTNIIWAAFYCLSNLEKDFRRERPFMSTTLCVLRHWLFGVLGCGFIIFVVKNNGIVLGDKSAHEPHLHFPQIFYFALFCSLTSFPLLLANLPLIIQHFRRNITLYMCLAACMGPLVGHFSYEHPYLLADNRHFTFYIWRRWFLRNEVFKYLTIPLYILSFGFLYVTAKNIPSFTLISGFVCTCLCLIPAHLVEFRYFIIPFVLWRSFARPTHNSAIVFEISSHILINVITIYLFLYRPFRWSHDPANLQRFMW